MDFLAIIMPQIAVPTGFWQNFIFSLEGALGDYALALILITLIIKFILLPLDFINKLVTKKNTRKQAELQPEIEKIKKRYATNSNMVNQKTMELYKRENYSLYGTCFGMLAYMIVTMVVFITLFSALNQIAPFKIKEEFVTMYDAYYQNDTDKENSVTYEGQELIDANARVIEAYETKKSSFLWIKNIWRPDNFSSVTLSYDEFIKQAGSDFNALTEEEYNKIISPVKELTTGWNGYFILTILAVGSTFLSLKLNVWITKYKAKKKGLIVEKAAGPDATKTMSIIMPIIMGAFTLFNNSAFGLYIVTGAIFALITNTFISIFVDRIDEKRENREKEKYMVEYSRKRSK